MKKELKTTVFQYSLPTGTPEEYANEALAVLMKIEKQHPPLLPYMLASDVVLTLSGVRAFDTYINLEGLPRADIAKAVTLLAESGIFLFTHDSEYDHSDKNIFSLIHHEALRKIPQQYTLSAWVELQQPFIFDRLLAWAYVVESNIFRSIDDNILPKEWGASRWAAHNIRFGILLGYPGEAIASDCWGYVMHAEGNNPETLNADISYNDMHGAARPIYSFDKELQSNPSIIEHQALWSEILTRVYESSWYEAASI